MVGLSAEFFSSYREGKAWWLSQPGFVALILSVLWLLRKDLL